VDKLLVGEPLKRQKRNFGFKPPDQMSLNRQPPASFKKTPPAAQKKRGARPSRKKYPPAK